MPRYYDSLVMAVREFAAYLADQGWEARVYGRHASTYDADRNATHESRCVWPHELLECGSRERDFALAMNVANGCWLRLLKTWRIPTLANVWPIERDRAKWGRLCGGA
jgi:hypothetical protein